ncbi:MAG: diadenylate cyclase [Flavobacteriales bacterium AspAUS03]
MDLIEVSITNLFDVLLVAIVLFQIYRLVRGTVGLNIFYGIIIMFVCWKFIQSSDMVLLNEILNRIFSVGFVALIVVFQPELRRFLLTLGSRSFIRKIRRFVFGKRLDLSSKDQTIEDLVQACTNFSDKKIGALIAIQVQEPIDELVRNGDVADILVTFSILENIFPRTSTLHDGAILIIGDRIVKTRAALPSTERKDLPNFLGFRHRAAMGLCERSDAICIVVSERTGHISYVRHQERTLVPTAELLRERLTKDLHPAD